jgi:hypothetical protein
VVSFLKLVEWLLAPVVGGKLSSILSFLVQQQLLEGFQSLLEKVRACSANLIQTKDSQDIHTNEKKACGGKEFEVAHWGRVCWALQS